MSTASMEEKPSPETDEPPVAELEWDSPDDPANPKNWSKGKKIYNIIVPGLIALQVSMAVSLYSSTIPHVMKKFDISSTVALLGLSLYTLGLVLGPALGAPMSETRGRKAVYMLSLPISLLFHLGSGLANNPAALFVCRFFAGTIGSPALAIGAGSAADMWEPKDAGPAATLFIITPFLGPAIGPVIGGLLATVSRRWFAYFSVIFGTAVFILTFFASETYAPVLLRRRALARGQRLPSGPSPRESLKLLVFVTLLRPISMLFTEPIVGLLSLYTGFCFGVMFIFFEGYPVSFIEAYGFSYEQVGFTFIAIGLGVICGGILFIVFDRTIYQKQGRRCAPEDPAPEHRLYAAMVGSWLVPLGVFWFSWTTRREIHWISPVIAGGFFGAGNFAIFLSTATYLVDTYSSLTIASAIAANGIVRYIFGAAFPLFSFQMYDNLGRHWAGSLLGFITLAMLPLPWVFFKFGPGIRGRSRFVE